MDNIEKNLDLIENVIHCCFSKGRCLDCNFYEIPFEGHPGKCMGMKKIGPLLEGCIKDIRTELKNGKKK